MANGDGHSNAVDRFPDRRPWLGELDFTHSVAQNLHRQNILLNRTREELAKEYTTKAESRADMSRVIDRLEALDAKLDRIIERK